MTLKDRAIKSLRATERYAKTDMVYLAKNGGWALVGTGLSWAISLGTAYAFANFISRETYGTYQYVLSIADLFGILVMQGIDTALARAVARGSEGSIREALIAKIRWGLIGGIGAAVLGSYYLIHGNQLLGGAFLLAGIAIPFWEAPGIYVAYLQGKKRFDLGSLYDVGAQFMAAIAIILALLFSKDLLVILFAYFATWGCARAFFLWKTLRALPPNQERDPGIISYGKHLTAMSAAGSLAGNVDTVLLWHLLGPVSVAQYVFAQAVPQKVIGLQKTVNRLAFPKFAERGDLPRSSLLPKILLLVLLSGFVFVAYALTVPFVFRFFLPQYVEAIPYAQLAGLLIVLQPFSLLSTSLLAQAKHRALYLFYFGTPIARIALFIALIPPFHIIGAISGLIGAKLVECVALVILHERFA